MSQTEYRQTSFTAPPGATEIILVRHGESRAATPAQPFPLVDGHGDPELHENGHRQAEAVGLRLRAEPIDAIYVTSLRRTAETAAPLANHLGLQPIVEPDLREVFLGEWEGGVLRQKAHENDPIYLQMREEQRWDVIPGAESWQQLHERLMRGLGRIHAQHVDQRVVAVVHGGVIAHIVAHASGARPFAFQGADNGSISHIVMLNDTIIVRSFNDSVHVRDTLHADSGKLT